MSSHLIVNQLADGELITDYEVNSDGYIVPAGSPGAVLELPVKLDEDGDGTADKVEKKVPINSNVYIHSENRSAGV